MELFAAHNQWSTRPADQRFESLQALYDATLAYRQSAREKMVPYSDLRTEASNGEVQLVGKAGVPARLTHWSFGQLAARVEAPASYLRKLPATLAAQNLNHGLATNRGDSSETAKLMFHANGSLVLRALTSERYERIWNFEVAERLLSLESNSGWEVARPDVRSISGDGQLPLYASDHDMFVFMRTRNVTVNEPGTDEPIYRGVIVENSEVGASALKLTRFLYRYMCGNHIIWGASKVMDLSVRHIGQARERWNQFGITVRQWADESADEETTMIRAAKERIIAATKDEVLDAIFGKRAIGLSRRQLTAGYDAVVPDQDGNPNSVWGMVQGLTRYSQQTTFADERTAIDRAAGKLLEVTF
jgi:Domain of unknown function (DUF932)